MPHNTIWRCPYAYLRAAVERIKQNQHLYSAGALRLAKSSKTLLDILDKKEYNTEEELAHLTRRADQAQFMLRHDPELQPFEDTEVGMIEKEICDAYGTYRELDFAGSLLGVPMMLLGEAYVFGDIMRDRMERYRQLVHETNRLLGEIEYMKSLWQRFLSGDTTVKVSNVKHQLAFHKAAERLELDCDTLEDALANLDEYYNLGL